MFCDVQSYCERFDPRKVHDGAVCLLSKVGMHVPRHDLREKLARLPELKVKNERVFLSERLVNESAAKLRSGPLPPKPEDMNLRVVCFRHPFFYIDPEDQGLKPFTVRVLKQYTRLVDSLRDTGLAGSIPGWPQDVVPQLRPIVQYYIECRYSRGAHFSGLCSEPAIMDFMKRMAEVMGHPFGIGVETFSPLSFSGNSLEAALHYQNEIPGVGLDPMPIMGVTAPMDLEAGWAQSAAENLGGYSLLRLLGFREVSPSFRLFPGSMRSGLAAFGAPEYLVALLSRRRVREFYHLPCAYSETMMTDAKCPDQQAAAEKAVLSACAAMAGFRAFESAGSLFIDEIFSPQQLLVDIEIKDYIQHALSGARRERSIDEIQELVSEGLDGNGFLGAPNTVDNWRSFYWRPSLYLQTSRSNWQLAPRKVLDAAWESARAKISAHTYELGGEKLRGLEEILAEACEAFGGKSALPTVLGPL